MKKLIKDVYLETGYAGVVLGAIKFERGVMMIDAPLRAEDGQSWKEDLSGMGVGLDRMLINLDSHFDRVLGAKEMGFAVLAQQETVDIFNQRPAVFKAQQKESGSEWETLTGLSGIRWQYPEITFSDKIKFNWGKKEIYVEHHPGPEPGAAWVVLPTKKVVFVGDAVVVKQPPYLASANLKVWMDTLDVLLEAPYSGYKIISGRSGLVTEKDIQTMKKLLKDIDKKMDKLGKRKAPAQGTEALVDKIVANFSTSAKYKKMHMQRVKHGLFHYYTKQYLNTPKKG